MKIPGCSRSLREPTRFRMQRLAVSVHKRPAERRWCRREGRASHVKATPTANAGVALTRASCGSSCVETSWPSLPVENQQCRFQRGSRPAQIFALCPHLILPTLFKIDTCPNLLALITPVLAPFFSPALVPFQYRLRCIYCEHCLLPTPSLHYDIRFTKAGIFIWLLWSSPSIQNCAWYIVHTLKKNFLARIGV